MNFGRGARAGWGVSSRAYSDIDSPPPHTHNTTAHSHTHPLATATRHDLADRRRRRRAISESRSASRVEDTIDRESQSCTLSTIASRRLCPDLRRGLPASVRHQPTMPASSSTPPRHLLILTTTQFLWCIRFLFSGVPALVPIPCPCPWFEILFSRARPRRCT